MELPPASKSVETLTSRHFLSASIRAASLCSAQCTASLPSSAVGVKDGNGFISRIRSDGQLDLLHFIQGGRNGVVLNGPMGSRIRGDTLWVLDIDALRAFDTRSGAPITSVDLTPVHPLLPNDLTFGPDGDIYITDTGRRVNPDGTAQDTRTYRIYRVTRDRQVSVALESPALDAPDGIAWDPRRRDLVLAPIGGQAIQTWRPGGRAPVNVAPGPGRFDGLEVQADGRVLFTSWNDSTVSELRGIRIARLIGPLGAASRYLGGPAAWPSWGRLPHCESIRTVDLASNYQGEWRCDLQELKSCWACCPPAPLSR